MFRSLLTIAILLLSSASCPAVQAQEDSHWVGTFATAPEYTGPGDMPQTTTLAGTTLRQVVRVSVGGTTVRVQLSNHFSESDVDIRSVYLADAGDTSSIVPSSARYLTFSGRRSLRLRAGAEVYSDPLRFHLRPLQRVAVTVVYGGQVPQHATSHRGSRTHSYIAAGEVGPRRRFVAIEKPVHWYNLTRIEVLGAPQTEAVAILGNSITDGRGSTTDAQNRWPDFMMQRLQEMAAARGQDARTGVLNLGIGGNCVLRGGLSEPGVRRFQRDILTQAGVRKLIIFEGTNDIGLSKGNTEQVAADLIKAYQSLIAQAHAQGIKVYGATITPMKGNGWFSYFHEAARRTVNEWVRTSGAFDGVIDFDRLTRDPDDPERLRPDYSDDWLHLNPAGYEAMGRLAAEAIF